MKVIATGERESPGRTSSRYMPDRRSHISRFFPSLSIVPFYPCSNVTPCIRKIWRIHWTRRFNFYSLRGGVEPWISPHVFEYNRDLSLIIVFFVVDNFSNMPLSDTYNIINYTANSLIHSKWNNKCYNKLLKYRNISWHRSGIPVIHTTVYAYQSQECWPMKNTIIMCSII